MAGMRDVAKLAGVSLSTVSVVLNDTGKYVSEEQRKKVYAAAEALEYRLPPKKRFSHKTIAVILPVITSSFFSNLLNGIEETISPDKSLLLYYNSNYNFEKEKECLLILKKQSLAGIILNSICPSDAEKEYFVWLKEEFIEKGIPIVLLERKVVSEDFYCIYINNFESAYAATRHLIESGHKKIGHISGNDKMLHTYERYEGYKKALADAGIPFDPELVQKGDFTPFSGYTAAKKLLNIRMDFTALFSANDQMAIGAMKAVKGFGKKIPDDIAVAGFDNLSVSSLVEPALTTINVPAFQMGRLSGKLVLNASDGEQCERMNLLETNLIVRRSSKASANNEWELTGW